MATVTSWVKHLSADEVAGAVYPFIGTEWLWLTIAVVFWVAFHIFTGTGEAEEQQKLSRKRPGANDYKKNITDW